MDFRTRGIKLSKGIILVAYCAAVFLVAVIVISRIMNGGNTDMTMEMSEANLPVVSFRYGGYEFNRIYGYTKNMDVSLMRDCITPLSEGRKLSFKIDTYGITVSKISYELRTTDGERLIENNEVFNYVTGASSITGDIEFKDLMYKDTEYVLVIILDTDNSEHIMYYTKIIDSDDLSVDEKLRFAYEFQKYSMDKVAAQTNLPTYIESNAKGDNSSFAYVDIHSSLNQITWGALNPEMATEPMACLKAVDKDTAVVELDYFIKTKEKDAFKYYRVNEYFRVKPGTERMFLLDYSRRAQEVFSVDTGVLANNKIVLGVGSPDVNMQESPDGNKIAFVNDGRLYTYNTNDNKLAYVYGFYEGDVTDERNINNQHEIKIFNIDETGNVYFQVYGYMNRGIHEGEMGSAIYYYDSVLNTVEEKMYINTTEDYEMLKESMEKVSFVNRYNVYFYINSGTLYKINLENDSKTVIAENLNSSNAVINNEKSVIAWIEKTTERYGDRIVIYDMGKGKQSYIEAEDGMVIKPVGFFGNDIVYGVIDRKNISVDITGKELLPMHKMVISNGSKTIKEYQEPGQYIVGYRIEDKIIHLERATTIHGDGTYSDITYDQILNNSKGAGKKNTIETVAIDKYETIVQIALRNDIEAKTLQILTPRLVITEKDKETARDIRNKNGDFYYTYDLGRYSGKYERLSDAVCDAYENNGLVVQSDGRVLYRKKSRIAKNQIMAIDGSSLDEKGNDNTVAVCINTILEYNGINADVTRNVNEGEKPYSILERNLTDKVMLNLTGCPLDAVLNYVEMDYPVLAYVSSTDAVLIIGYNEFNTVLLNPKTGTIYKYGINDSTELFEKNGNRFITYTEFFD